MKLSGSDIYTGESAISSVFNALSSPSAAPDNQPGMELSVITPSKMKDLLPQGDGLDGARQQIWSKLG